MADFNVTIDDTQKVLATALLTKANGTSINILGMTVTQMSGDASFLMTDSQGVPLPVNQVYFVSGTDGDSLFVLNIANDAGPAVQANVLVTVIAGAISVSITFGTPEPK